MITSRRSLLTGLGALIAAPAIVRASSLMPVKAAPAEMIVWGETSVYGISPVEQAIRDLMIFGTGAVKVTDAGEIEHVDARTFLPAEIIA